MKTFWRWTGTLFFAFAFIFLTVTGIGTSIPMDHFALCSAQIAVPSTELIRTVLDDGSSRAWRPELRNVTLLSGEGPTAIWQETNKYGQVLTLRTTVEVQHDPMHAGTTLIVRKTPFSPRLGFGGIWVFEVPASGRAGATSSVSVSEQSRIYNPLYRSLAKYVFGYTATLQTYLTDLARKYGETPEITCSSGSL